MPRKEKPFDDAIAHRFRCSLCGTFITHKTAVTLWVDEHVDELVCQPCYDKAAREGTPNV